MASGEPSIEYLQRIEYAARRFHDIYFGRLVELGAFNHTGAAKIAWEEYSQQHRDSLLYAIEMLEREGTIEITPKS